MNKRTNIFDMRSTKEQPPELAPLIGKRVLGAWTTDGRSRLIVRLEGEVFVQFWRIPAMGLGAIGVELGRARPDNESFFEAIDQLPQDDYERALTGTTFTGLDGSVVTFGNTGAHIGRGRIEWVKQAKEPS